VSRLLTISVCLLFVLVSVNAQAQDRRFEIGAYAGYLFGGTIEGESELVKSTATIESAPSYGAMLDVALRDGAFAEFSYTRHPTEIALKITDHTTPGDTQVTTERYEMLAQYFQVGGLLEFHARSLDWFRPIFGGTIGATVFTANDEQFSYEEWRLSLIFEGGAKIRLANFLGLRFQARLLSTFLTDESAVFCAGGACAVAATGSLLFQGEVGAGAYLAF
jgi:hypothetical protein